MACSKCKKDKELATMQVNDTNFKQASAQQKIAAGYAQVIVNTPYSSNTRNLDSKSRQVSAGYGRVKNGSTIWMHKSDIALKTEYERFGWAIQVVGDVVIDSAPPPKEHESNNNKEPKVNEVKPSKQ